MKQSAADRDELYAFTIAQLVDIASLSQGVSTRPYFPFFVDKWLSSARRQSLSIAAQGAYMNLLCREWKDPRCSLPTDIDELGILAGVGREEWQKMAHEVTAAFVRFGDRLYSEMLLRCRSSVALKSDRCRSAVNLRWQNNAGNATNDTNVLRNDTNVSPPSLSLSLSLSERGVEETSKGRSKTTDGYTSDFEAFWSLYPRKIAKGAAFKAWVRLKSRAAVLSQIRETLKWQVASESWTKDGGQFIPHPATYLNQRRWEDASQIAVAEQVPTGPAYHRPAPSMTEDEKLALRERHERMAAAGSRA